MTVVIQRPKDLTAATEPVADTDYLVVDQNENGVKKVTYAQIKSAALGTAVGFSTGTASPEGIIVGRPSHLYFRKDGDTRELWIKDTGVDTATGWILAITLS